MGISLFDPSGIHMRILKLSSLGSRVLLATSVITSHHESGLIASAY